MYQATPRSDNFTMPPLHEHLSAFHPPRKDSKPGHPLVNFITDLLHWFTKSRTCLRPPPLDLNEESAALACFLEGLGKILLVTMGTLFALIAFLVIILRCFMLYDRYQTRHGPIGIELSRREDAMVRACERRGRLVVERMEKERMERKCQAMDKRQEEYLRRQSILRGKRPMADMMGSAPVPGVGEGPAPKPSLERKISKREERRGAGTQILSEEEDTLRKRMVFTLPRGAEGRIGNSVWRSSSGQTIRRCSLAFPIMLESKRSEVVTARIISLLAFEK